ncbi:RagB/SusD family nutrient uptake outer membrane protein [Longitalea luteola]|uniref:RagB/SusD family nutrient uptake outer membrane protein n=1 Tax=Longitalea luteola TaxID=2812563 RepID=UPI001A96A6D2|nr:RagB/SusD family nutrient uptake outer membrane protein [Longitalea luteola]
MKPNSCPIKFICLWVLLSSLTIASCKKLVQVDEPDDSLTTSTVFSNDSLAQVAVNGLYIKIMTNTKFLLNGGMSLFPGLSADELLRTSTMNNEEQFFQNAINPNNLLVNSNLWKAAYSYIYHCNICMEGLHKSTGVTAEIRKRLTGEVLFVRALCYYYLVNLYGDVPLVLGTNAEVNAMLARAASDKVYIQMESDLLAATDALAGTNINTRPTQYAAMALLARVYLHMQYWSRAEEMANAVITAGQFTLANDLNAVFKTKSPETIFQWAPVTANSNSGEGFIFVPSSAAVRPNYTIDTGLLAAFEANDLRRHNWVRTVMINGIKYDHPHKYKVFRSPVAEEYNVVLRLAEQYLIRAEARARQLRTEEAVDDINVIRTRAGLPAIAKNISNDQCLQQLQKQRRVELFAEWGHRWFDLKRTQQADAILGVAKGGRWQAHDQLYPIPFTELENAPNLEQNSGY